MVRFISHGKTVFKDISVLDFNYLPIELPHREKQLTRLFTLFSPILKSIISQNVFLFGSVGSGKTATAKRFCLDFQKEAQTTGKGIDFVLINCRSIRGSEQGVLLKILNHFDPHFPDRGFSIAEMFAVLRKHLENKNIHLIVVLDEAEVLLKMSGSSLIYNMSRFDDEKIVVKGSVSLILISQKYVYEMLDEASLSSFKRTNAIEFYKYSDDELFDILKQRSVLAFHANTIKDGTVHLIANIAAEFGDARYAIELIEKAGMLADEEGTETIVPEHVRTAKANIYSTVTQTSLAGLNREILVFLLSIARAMKNKPYLTTGEVEKSYASVCEEYNEAKKGHTRCWEYFKSLDAIGLIDFRKSADEISGNTSMISLTEIPAKVLMDKIEDVLGKKGKNSYED